jgi:SAM-dependent methyltransferase
MEWPSGLADIGAELARRLGFSGLHIVRELSGASGARTFMCRPESAAGRPHSVIVKIGPAGVMAADLGGLLLARTMFRDAGAMLDSHLSAGGLVAIPLTLAGRSPVTLAEWYAAASSADAAQLVDEIFIDVLRVPQLTVSTVNHSAFACYTITDPAALRQRLAELGDEGKQLWRWWRQAAERSTAASARRLGHGDLHSGNILCSDGPARVSVVDFGATGNHHYLRDFARLEREVWLVLHRPGDADRVSSCAALAAAHDDPAAADGENAKAMAMLGRLRSLAKEHSPSAVDMTGEYEVALLAQFMFAAASRAAEPVRRAALARAQVIRRSIEARHPELALDRATTRRYARMEALGLLAYSLLRLDQLPNGAWGKSVNNWMESLWAGDHGTITRDANMRRNGGTDVTCSNLINLVTWLRKVLPCRDAADLLLDNECVSRAAANIASRRGPLGGVGSRFSGRGPNDVRIRHTVMAILALLHDSAGHLRGHERPDAALSMANYLIDYLPLWKADTSHLFGCCLATARLIDALDSDLAALLPQATRNDLRSALTGVLPGMLSALHAEEFDGNRRPRPVPPEEIRLGPPFFWPYSSFWRMERSGLLMYLPLVISPDGTEFLPEIKEQLGGRIVSCLRRLLDDVRVPFDPTQPQASLLRYHRGPDSQVHRDWGLTAELAALLELPAVTGLLATSPADEARVKAARGAIHAALLETFDRYLVHKDLFHHTHAASFFRVLWILSGSTPPVAALRALDADIRATVAAGVTEAALTRHVAVILAEAGATAEDVDAEGLVSFLAGKLEAGYYTPDGVLCTVPAWQRILAATDTLAAYRGERAAAFAAAAGESHLRIVEPVLEQTLARLPDRTRRALDLGCGCGRHAALLKRMGFAVELADLSADMLNITAKRIGVPPPEPADMRQLAFAPATFDVVVTAESVIHLTPAEVPPLLARIQQVLRPGGVAYLTFQVGNHALISADGRYYAYCPDERYLQDLMTDAGLEPVYVMPRPVESYELAMYPTSTAWTWRDLYCRKPDG